VSAAYLLIAAAAWASATQGGTSGRDLAVVTILVAGTRLIQRRRPRFTATFTGFVALMGWLMADGPIRTGFDLEATRVPLLALIAFIAASCVSTLAGWERELLVDGVIVIGCLQALIALSSLLVDVAQSGVMSASRTEGLIGYSNALGALLLVSTILTARAMDSGPAPVLSTALVAQSVAILSTGSRGAIGFGLLVCIVVAFRRPGWVPWASVAVGGAVAMTIAIVRVVEEPSEQRPHLWWSALRRIGQHPLTGVGPHVPLFDPTAPNARLTTDAHSEMLQFTLEYGVIGLLLAILVAFLSLRTILGTQTGGAASVKDPWMAVATVFLLAGGLVDFYLRVTVLTLVTSMLLAMAIRPEASAAFSDPAAIEG
jgi:hypothetical protein